MTSSATPKARTASPTWPRDFDIRARYAEQQERLQPQRAPHPTQKPLGA